MNFICYVNLRIINNYKFTMGKVDISDQLQGNYQIDIWVENRKWWLNSCIFGTWYIVDKCVCCVQKMTSFQRESIQN